MSNSSSSTLSSPLPVHARGHDLIKSVVLVDSPQITGPVGEFLRQSGWTVHEASNCGQARALIMRHQPELVIMELLLPLETGFEFSAYLKKSNCRTSVMIFTEVPLEEARNLAMWAGADAYLTKPTEPARLYQQILAAAQRVSFHVRQAETNLTGAISFRCKCGKALRVGSKHAGRAVICPECKHLARCPESTLDSGTLYRSLIDERRGMRSRRTGIACSHCDKTVDPRTCRVRDRYECPHCGQVLKISSDFLEQWLLFFGDQAQVVTPVTEFNPLRYVFVQCEHCRSLHQYFRDVDTPQPCPSCGHQHSLPSIRGVPVSRAALASTGRLFEFRLNDGGSKLFLLPSRRKWIVGSSPACPISLQNQPLHPQHCVLRNSLEGPVLLRADHLAPVSVNEQPVNEKVLLKPGDEIQLGEVRLILHGTPEHQLRRRLATVLNEISERQKVFGELELAEPGARILQYYWELLRLRWIDHLRHQQQAMSGESSMIQQISSADLQ